MPSGAPDFTIPSNINIVAQEIDLQVVAPQAKAVNVGGCLTTVAKSDFFTLAAGSEVTILDVTGRGRLIIIGFYDSASTTDPRNDILTVEIDGDTVAQLELWQIDQLGGQGFYDAIGASATVGAKGCAPYGGLTQKVTDANAAIIKVGGFFRPESEFTSRCTVKIKNNTTEDHLFVYTIMWGVYP